VVRVMNGLFGVNKFLQRQRDMDSRIYCYENCLSPRHMTNLIKFWINFVSKVTKLDKVDGPEADKSEWIKLEFLMDPDNPALGSKYS
jgi:hypothetical protein